MFPPSFPHPTVALVRMEHPSLFSGDRYDGHATGKEQQQKATWLMRSPVFVILVSHIPK